MAINNMIRTTKEVIPVIYAYTTPEIKRHDGWTKIGDTGRDAGRRIDEQAWLIGAYTVKAMNASVGNMFLEKGKAPVRYPEEPLSMSKEEHAKEKTAEQEELEKNYAQAYMMNMVMFGKGWEKKKKQEGGDVPWQMGQSTV